MSRKVPKERNSLDSYDIASLLAQIIKQLGCPLLPARVLAVRVDDPDLSEADSCRQSSSLWISWNELDVLDSLTLYYS